MSRRRGTSARPALPASSRQGMVSPLGVAAAHAVAGVAVTAAARARPPLRESRIVIADHFEMDALLAMATVAPRDLVKTLMDIKWAGDVDARIAQIDARVTAVRGVEELARQRIIESPDLAGKPLPPVPPPAVLREFAVVMAARTAVEKLTETRAALARKR